MHNCSIMPLKYALASCRDSVFPSGKSESSDDNDDDDDFIEVSFNPAAAKPDDELFPANIFETRADQLESPPSIEIKDLSHDELENEEAKEVVNAEAASGSPPAKEEDSFDNEFDGMSKVCYAANGYRSAFISFLILNCPK